MVQNPSGESITLAGSSLVRPAWLLLTTLAFAQTLPPDFYKPREFRCAEPATHLAFLRVVSWNIDRGEELNRVADALTRERADLLLFQEVDWGTKRVHNVDVGEELARKLKLNLSYGIEFEELSQEQDKDQHAYIGQATLTRLPVKRSRILRFKEQSGFWKPHSWIPSKMPLMQRRLGDRIALINDLEFQGHLLVVYNAHLESRSYGRIQMDQLDEMLADLKQNYPPNTAVILGGDLNTKYLPSIFLHKLEREGFRSATGEQITRTHKIAMALDWIFVRGPYQFESGKVRKDVKGSDHYPLYAELIPSR